MKLGSKFQTIVLFRHARILVVLSLFAPVAALADGGGSAPPPSTPAPSVTETRPLSPEEQAAVAKHQAEETYAAAYRDVEKAQQELEEAGKLRAAGDAKSAKKADEREASATKRLTKSAGRFEQVVAALPDHADAWNMLGYTRRMTGDTQGAFDAYWKCLAIDPEHAGAHEYLGEAYLKAGKLAQAKGELAWLEKKGAKEAAILAASIAAWEKANPDAAKAAAKAEPAAEDKPSVTPPELEKK
jgi:tetratricopeptide (TPR) repeat protein